MNNFPNISGKSLDSALDWIKWVTRNRQNDINDRNNFPNLFIGGRKVSKIPADSSDITGSAVGDFNVTASYAFFCVDNSGTVEWVRVAVGTF